MLQYVIAGLVYGGIYAIAASGLVVTYQATGIFNFAFASLAYAIARFDHFLNTQHNWAIVPVALVAIVVTGPALGIALYFVLFKRLRLARPLIKVVATIGVSVAIPPAATLIFGNETILSAPGLAPGAGAGLRCARRRRHPGTGHRVHAASSLIVVAGVGVLRFTDVGLRVRAMVDSPAMTSLVGHESWAGGHGSVGGEHRSRRVGRGAGRRRSSGWTPGDFTLLMVAAFAAVIVARLRSLPVAMVVGLGWASPASLVQYLLPPTLVHRERRLPSGIPFIITALFLIYFMIRGTGGSTSRTGSAGPSTGRSDPRVRTTGPRPGAPFARPSAGGPPLRRSRPCVCCPSSCTASGSD